MRWKSVVLRGLPVFRPKDHSSWTCLRERRALTPSEMFINRIRHDITILRTSIHFAQYMFAATIFVGSLVHPSVPQLLNFATRTVRMRVRNLKKKGASSNSQENPTGSFRRGHWGPILRPPENANVVRRCPPHHHLHRNFDHRSHGCKILRGVVVR